MDTPPPIPEPTAPSKLPAPSRPPLPFRESPSRRMGAMVAGSFAIFWLLSFLGLFRWLFSLGPLQQAGGVVSMSFIFVMPFAFGFFSVALGRWLGSDNWVQHSLLWPSLALFLALVASLVTRMEGAICVLMAAPILYVAALTGGAIAEFSLPRNRDDHRLQLTFAVFLPFVAAWLEGSMHWPTQLKSIETAIVIQAPAERIWPEIASVRTIPREQISNRWIYLVGFPKPISATLDHEGTGGVRTATFERGVSFFETVTVWDQPHKLAFTIHADPDFIPHTAFDRHIIVGGRFYDVLDGIYEIEPLSATSCRLHLTSHHRLGTRFNAYAGWWSERIMDQIQGSILEVIRARAETRAAAGAPPPATG